MRSPSLLIWIALSFPVLSFPVLSFPGLARADRVVVTPLAGTASTERVESTSAALNDALRALGHEPISDTTRAPTSLAQMQDIGRTRRAPYVLAASIAPLPGQYRLSLRCGYLPSSRIEEIEVNVVLSDEAARLRDVLRSILRPQGLGDDAVRLTEETPNVGDEEARRQEQARAEQARLEAEARARQEAEEAQRRTAEADARRAAEEEQARREREAQEQAQQRQRAEQEAREQTAWEQRPRYGIGRPWGIFAGGSIGYSPPSGTVPGPRGTTTPREGVMGGAEVRVGYGFEEVPGLELRGGLDFMGGFVASVNAVVGAAYLERFFVDIPIYLGGTAELGAWFNTSGARGVSFLLRGAGLVSWNIDEAFYLEAAIPQITWLPGAGMASIGAALHLGVKF